MTATPHLFTLTGNLLAERTLEFDSWAPGRTQRARRESFQVGGKGINVSKMLNRLGVKNTALCFVGGVPGAECERWLDEHGFAYRAFQTTTATRLGTVVRGGGHAETTFLGPDAAPDATAVRACAEFLDAQAGSQTLALCGSFPGWDDAPFEPMRDALARWLSRGSVAADTYGPPLTWLLQQPVDLLKVNAAELGAAGIGAKADLPNAPLRCVVTDGGRPVRAREGMGAEFTLEPPKIREVSPTGSGDVLLACLLDSIFCRKRSLRDALVSALPFAAANAAHSGVAEFPLPVRV
jgi:1-phosphofructokinase